MSETPRVGLVMGSNSDWDVMQHAANVLTELGIAHESRVVSAHRTSAKMMAFASGARDAGFQVIIAGAGGAAAGAQRAEAAAGEAQADSEAEAGGASPGAAASRARGAPSAGVLGRHGRAAGAARP